MLSGATASYSPEACNAFSASSTLPVAFGLWSLLSVGLFAAAVAQLTGRWELGVFALTAPIVKICLLDGQTGLLTARAFGFAMVNIERQPAAAGLVLSLFDASPTSSPSASASW